LIKYLVKLGIDRIPIYDVGRRKETLLAALEHPAQGLTQTAPTEAMAVFLRTVTTYWNQYTRV